MKTIIFIGGTARSGSTLLDLILSNDSKAMSLGEIQALFRPTRKHHFEERKKLLKNPVWNKIIKNGQKFLYSNLINTFSDKDIFIDSSKNPFWYRYHEKRINSNIELNHILIHKTPQELAKSFKKRNKLNKLIKSYVSYHKKYFSLIDDFVSVSYKDLIQDENTLKNLCSHLNIRYFEGKKNYWEKKNPTLFFGSNTVKSVNSLYIDKQITNQTRMDLSYDVPNENFIAYINPKQKSHTLLKSIEKTLNSHSINNTENNKVIPQRLKYYKLTLFLILMKKWILTKYRILNPKDYFSKK